MTLCPSAPYHPLTLEKGKCEDPRTCSFHVLWEFFVLAGPEQIAWCSSMLRVSDLCPGSLFHRGIVAGMDRVSDFKVLDSWDVFLP